MHVLPQVVLDMVRCHPGRIFCRKQAFKAGFNDRALTAWLEAGLTKRLAPGWYRVVEDVVPADQKAWLALEYMRGSSGRPRPLLSGSIALRVHGVVEVPNRIGR